jgi:formate/nitrite transporter
MLAGKSNWKQLAKSWIVSYIFNFAGCAVMAYFGTYLPSMFDETSAQYVFVQKLGWTKSTQLGWGSVVLRGIGANWLVCLALYLAISSESFEGKIIGIWIPIMTFVAVGYEHSVANMYFCLTGLMYTSTASSDQYYYTFGDFIAHNLIPSTIGNIIGGSFFVAGVYYYVYREHTATAIKHMHLFQGKHRVHLWV